MGAQVRQIDLEALRSNVRAIRSAVPPQTALLAVVKADAYGHGAPQIARAALEAGASWLAVAHAEEGAVLRQAGLEAPILVLGAVTPGEASVGAACGLTLTVCTPEMVRLAEEAALRAGTAVRVHLKLDTGMGRIGVRSGEEVRAVLSALDSCPHVSLTGAFTHFAVADELTPEADAYTAAQLRRFEELTALLPAGILRHCANSAAIHRLMPRAAFDMVRMGISLYGYPPVPTDLPLRPVMRWLAPVTHVKALAAGESVSYGRVWTAPRPSLVATIACGYGDGYHRAATGRARVLLRGHSVPVVGRICMDQMMADVTDVPGVRPGDMATLLGEDGDARITAEDLAAWAGTISYEVLLAATGRVDRVWLHE